MFTALLPKGAVQYVSSPATSVISPPGENSSSSDYDTSELFGWVDNLDGPLYAEAALMFESALTASGVDASSCSSMCQDQSD
jgi:hypothetical protein